MNRSTPPIEGNSSISSLEKVPLNDLEQWVLIRGESVNNPIILFLHGGPGNAQIGWAPKYQTALEINFVIVNWDQRGSGLSYNDQIPEESMNINQFINDTYELTTYLINRFKKRKIFVVGHSWGSIIGMFLIQKFPDLFHAYIGVGQSVDLKRGELISYNFTLDYAIKHNIKEAIEELNQIGPSPYKDMFNGLYTQRKWLNKFGGVVAKDREFFQRAADTIRERPEYKEEDLDRLQKGNSFSMNKMWPEVLTVNLIKQVNEVKVPVYFLLGEFDYNTQNILIEEYYEALIAPSKKMIVFNGLAHNIPFEDLKGFADTMDQIAQNYSD